MFVFGQKLGYINTYMGLSALKKVVILSGKLVWDGSYSTRTRTGWDFFFLLSPFFRVPFFLPPSARAPLVKSCFHNYLHLFHKNI